MLNQVCLAGRLVRDPEIRYTQSMVPFASFTLACEQDIADKSSGEAKVDFLDVVTWRTNAEFADKWLKKGMLVMLRGRLQVTSWEDKDGNKRRNTEIVAEKIYFAENRAPGDKTITRPAKLNFTDVADLSEPDSDLPY